MQHYQSKLQIFFRTSIQLSIWLLLCLHPFNTNVQMMGNSTAQSVVDDQVFQSSFDINIPILAYHKIEPEALTHWYVSTNQLSSQMDVLLAYGYHPITLDDFISYQQGIVTPPDKPIVITFDDGTDGHYIYAAQILQSKEISATFFIPTGFIGETPEERQDTSWQSSGDPLSNHMIWPEIIELYNEGFQIEAHSVSHPNLVSLPYEIAENEILQARIDIQNHLPSNPVNFFAYPYGLDNPTIQGLVQSNGYSAAVDFDADDDIANPATSILWELPRRGIYKDVTLDLDPQDPWWFFMRRVDPSFPIPNITFYNDDIYDDSGAIRHQFYQGEPLTLTVRTSNWLSPANVIGSLSLMNQSEKVYDSHLQVPTTDIQISPHIYGSGTGIFTYTWLIPDTIQPGVYSYTLTIKDEHYLLGYYNSGSKFAFSVEQPPVTMNASPQELFLGHTDEADILFNVDYSEDDAEEMYLTISLSPGISVDSVSPTENWTIIPPGSWVTAKGCETPCIQTNELIYELYTSNYIGGSETYSMTVTPTEDASGIQYIHYRLAMEIPDQLTNDPFLRVPFSGEIDQQLYYARSFPIHLLENVIFLPIITR